MLAAAGARVEDSGRGRRRRPALRAVIVDLRRAHARRCSPSRARSRAQITDRAAGRRGGGDPAARRRPRRAAAARAIRCRERVHHAKAEALAARRRRRCGARTAARHDARRPPSQPRRKRRGSSLLRRACGCCRKAERAGDVRRSTPSAAPSTTSPTTSRATAPTARAALDALARRSRRLYAGGAAGRAAVPGRRRRAPLRPRTSDDFVAVIDGMAMDVDARHPLAADAPTLDLYCDRVASAVGRLSVRDLRHGARRRGSRWRTTSAARCSSPTSCATSTRMPRSAGSTCRARRSTRAGIAIGDDPRSVVGDPRIDGACARSSPARRARIIAAADAILAQAPARPSDRAAPDGGRLRPDAATGWSSRAGRRRARACATSRHRLAAGRCVRLRLGR